MKSGWSIKKIKAIASINPRHDKTTPDNTSVSFVPMPVVNTNGPDLLPHQPRLLGEVRKGYTHFRDGDVLFAKITPCMENGKAAIARNLVNGLGCGTTELHVMRPNSSTLPEWLYFFVWQESFRKEAEQNMTGTAGQLRVPLAFIENHEIPIPDSIAEQKRIIKKLNRISARLAEVKTRLTAVPTLLKRFRQSVLAAACSARLTEDWRKNHFSESASKLISQIQNAVFKLASGKAEKSKIESALKAFPPLLGADAGLPDNWVSCPIGAIGNVCNGSTPSRKNPIFWGNKIPWISSGEVQNCLISSTKESISQEGFDNCSVRILPKGTVLIAMIGEGKTRGQTAILDIEATINQNIAAVIIDHGLIVPRYLWFWFQGNYETNREVGSGSGPQALNCQRVRELPFHLPPIEEQKEIVHRVEELMYQADGLESHYKKAMGFVDKLMSSIIIKAFRAELL